MSEKPISTQLPNDAAFKANGFTAKIGDSTDNDAPPALLTVIETAGYPKGCNAEDNKMMDRICTHLERIEAKKVQKAIGMVIAGSLGFLLYIVMTNI